MTMVRCECCKGSKTIVGLGNIAKKCHECKGMGFVECTDIGSVVIEHVKLNEPYTEQELDVVSNKNNDSIDPKEQKKIDQSLRAKAMWAKRKAAQQ